jgi:hypothetical protein
MSTVKSKMTISADGGTALSTTGLVNAPKYLSVG